jgi:exosortase/archaeosortase family protein
MATRGRIVFKALIVFTATYGALMAIVLVWGQSLFEGHVNLWTAQSAAYALSLLGAQGRAYGDLVGSTLGSFRIVSECTVLYPAIIFVSAVLAAPASWKERALASIGLPILVVVNLVRIVSLCYIAHAFPDALEVAHYVVWQSLMIFFTLFLWLLWAYRAIVPHEASRA